MSITDQHYPVEYITGTVNFFGKKFVVTPDVLIPRLETECLVRRARSILNFSGKVGEREESTMVIDVGCGSGIIGTSVADLADEVVFLDISSEALVVAEGNFRLLFPEKKAEFVISDLLENLLEKGGAESVGRSGGLEPSETPIPLAPLSQGGKILFLANLPYIKAEDWANMSPDTRYEPELALFGGEITGFEMYERLFAQIAQMLPSLLGEGQGVRCIIEFGFDQREVAEKVIKKYDWKYEFFSDYAGIERFCEIELT